MLGSACKWARRTRTKSPSAGSKTLFFLKTDRAPVGALIYQVKEVNKLLPWCPSRKHLPNAPDALPVPRKLTEFELCTMVLVSSMRPVLT